MAKKNDFAKRAEDLLTARINTAHQLGELLNIKAEQEAAVADTVTSIEKAVTECLGAGWKPAELIEIGVPKNLATPRRTTRNPKTEPHPPTPGHNG